jgi:hypothetical protein
LGRPVSIYQHLNIGLLQKIILPFDRQIKLFPFLQQQFSHLDQIITSLRLGMIIKELDYIFIVKIIFRKEYSPL